MTRYAARFNFDRRASGLLLHPTSLPGAVGNGDLGPAAHAFVDFLAAAGQRWWQMLPVGPPGEGHSPYSAASAFAGHPALVSLEELARHGLLKRSEIASPPRFNPRRVEHDRSVAFREGLLRQAFERFRRDSSYSGFLKTSRFWLEDFALFTALKRSNGGRPWSTWDRDLRTREPEAVDRAKREHAAEIEYQKFVQFQFNRQWLALRQRCAESGVGLIGDIPIFVAHDSAEVWANPHLFLLTRDGRPKVVSGCPPDFFNRDGQKWNHPHYDWQAHAAEGFRWWVERFRATLRWFDAVRIDHFLGFHRVWSIPASSATAKRGRYTPGPGGKFFEVLRRQVGEVPIIAEDLGSVTSEALALRDRFKFPGMRVLQFGFGEGGEYHLPHHYPRCCVAYTGTHDNDTTAGWLKSISADERRRVGAYTGSADKKLVWPLIRIALASSADTAIFPVQDLLELGAESRMNLPGTANGNWGWRLPAGRLTPAIARRLRGMCELFDRT